MQASQQQSWVTVEQGWTIGTRLWVRDAEEAWIPGIVLANEKVGKKVKITIQDTRNSEKEYVFMNDDSVSETEDMKYMNTKTRSTFANLVDLVVLNEPEVLHCLQMRYKVDEIYTYTGPILIATNPFKKLPELYNKDRLEFYYNFGLARSNFILQQVSVLEPPPHVYAIADKAYRNMMTGVESNYSDKASSAYDQSILISGESGAGKTESTKLIMQYLTLISSESREATDSSNVMDRVLLSNPILESVGNAKTLRNDNSSRFGKFIELKFNKRGFLNAGYIQTYMLEKVRVVSQQPGERNYHIFYQMGAGGSAQEKQRWGLRAIQDFVYANQGGVFTATTLDDKKGFEELVDAFSVFDVTAEDRECILDVMAALLHLGQITFVSDHDGEGSLVASEPAVKTSLATACKLLAVASEDLETTLTTKTIFVAKSKVLKLLTVAQAAEARDAIVKAVYSSFFEWLVIIINEQLVQRESEVQAQIGILDIFGFEYFKHNSFEQLCINYANEALQQHFVSFVFEYEQKEYKDEGIEWSFVEFSNNRSCLELINLKQRGIFSMIDDECLIPKGSDSNLASRMYKDLAEELCFDASIANKNDNEFTVRHFAGSVTYSVNTFTDKNRNEFPVNAFELLSGSKTPLIPLMFANSAANISDASTGGGDETSPTRRNSEVAQSRRPSYANDSLTRSLTGGGGGSRRAAKTVCSQFKEQLASLLAKIQATTAHYVRCIKPNDRMQPCLLERPRTVEQLKCAGVLEVVRLSRAGYPFRMKHEEFFARYRPCISGHHERRLKIKFPKTLAAGTPKQDPGVLCMELLDLLHQTLLQNYSAEAASVPAGGNVDCQKGTTKIFIPKNTYNLLEGARARLVYESSTRIQAHCRGYRFRRWFVRARRAGKRIRRFLRAKVFKVSVARRVARKKEAKRKAAAEAALKAAEQARRAEISLRAAEAALAATVREARRAAQQAAPPVVVVAEVVPELTALEKSLLEDPVKNKVRAPVLSQERAPLGPKRFEKKTAEEEEAGASPMKGGRAGSGMMLQVNHKKSTELEKMIYKEQFPAQWSTDRLLKFFQRDNIEDVETQALRESATTLRRFPEEKHYTAGQVKLVRVIGATEIVVNRAVVAGLSAEILATGDVLAKKALATWHSVYQVGAGDSVHVSGNVYEAKNVDGTRCYCKQSKPLGFPFGLRETQITRELTKQWKAAGTSTVGGADRDVLLFPLPILLGTLRTDKEIADPGFRRRWIKNFNDTEPPEEGELWSIYSWDKCSFKSLRTFVELPKPSAGFSIKSQANASDLKWRFVKRVIRRTVEGLEFVHGAGYCHGSISASAIWLRSFDPSEIGLLTIKLTELGLAEKVDGGPEGQARKGEDWLQLGFVLLTAVLGVFGSRSKTDVRELRVKLAGVDAHSLDNLSSTFNMNQEVIGSKELYKGFLGLCKQDVNELEKLLKTIPSWRVPMSMLGENGKIGWIVISKLITAGKTPQNFAALLDAFDR